MTDDRDTPWQNAMAATIDHIKARPSYPLCQEIEKMTLREARLLMEHRLLEAGVEAARQESRYLVDFILKPYGWSLLTDDDRPCDSYSIAGELSVVAWRRINREPLSQILGTQPFWTLDLTVTPDVLTPRADTETLVEQALKHMPNKDGTYSIVDLGTGSGAILLAILSERPTATGLGIDSSAVALEVAKANAQRNNLSDHVRFATGNWADGLADAAFDLAVSNPPYIATAVLAGLEPEVRDHEPHLALDGGADGLDVYRTLIPELFRIIRPGGHALVEIGYDQGEVVQALFSEAGFKDVSLTHDLGGNPRVVAGYKPAKV